MSTASKVRSMNVEDAEARPVLGPAGNKARLAGMARKPALKPVRKVERAEAGAAEEKMASPRAVDSPPLTPPLSASSVLRRHELLICSNGLWNRGISACGVCDGAAPIFRNNPIAVVGGDDSAME